MDPTPTPTVSLEGDMLVIRHPLKAQRVLDDKGVQVVNEAIKEFKTQQDHALRQITIQQDLEILAFMFSMMPEGETIEFIVQEHVWSDDVRKLRFSTGWEYSELMTDHRISHEKQNPEKPAPQWFNEDAEQVKLWDTLDEMLTWKTRDLLEKLSLGKPLTQDDLPTIRNQLLDPKWAALLDGLDMENSTVEVPGKRPGVRL